MTLYIGITGWEGRERSDMSLRSDTHRANNLMSLGVNMVGHSPLLILNHLTLLRILAAINLLILAAVIIITPARIGQWFNSLAISIKGMGWKGVVLCNIFASKS